MAEKAAEPLLARLTIRQAVKEDLAAIEWEGEYQHFRRIYADVFSRTRRGLALMWLAEVPEGCGPKIIGQAFVQLKMNDRRSANGKTRAYLHSFRVRAGYRDQGVGTAVMAHAESDLVRRGFRELTLNVAGENYGALRLYRRLGYRVEQEISGEWSYRDDKGKLRTVSEPGFRLIKQLSEGGE